MTRGKSTPKSHAAHQFKQKQLFTPHTSFSGTLQRGGCCVVFFLTQNRVAILCFQVLPYELNLIGL